ncbi:MAG: restriction endonuclease subunit S [Natronospirillum sp.]
MEQVLYQLPDGWHWHKLKELTTKIGSGATPKGGDKAYKRSGISLIRSLNVHDCLFKDDRLAFIDNEQADALKNVIVESGDVLLNITGASIARCCIVPDEFLPARVNQHVTIIRSTEKVESKFLNYLIVSPKFKAQLLWQGAGGATRQALTKAMVEELDIPLPSLPEQKRIVEKLDALLTRIDTAIEHLQESITLADALLKSSLSSMLSKHEHWEQVRLNGVCHITSKLCDPREEEYLDMYHVGGANITSFSGELIDLKKAREEKLISGKFPFDDSMVLYSKIRPYLMKVARPSISGICSADIYPLAPDSQKMTRDFLFYLLLSEPFTQYAIEGSSRAGMPKVNRNHLFNFEFHLPPIDEQKSICESLDALVDKTNEVNKELDSKLSYLVGIKTSILNSAFKGEL